MKLLTKIWLQMSLSSPGPNPSPSPCPNRPPSQREQGYGVVLHVQEEVYQSTLTFRRRVAGYQE